MDSLADLANQKDNAVSHERADKMLEESIGENQGIYR